MLQVTETHPFHFKSGRISLDFLDTLGGRGRDEERLTTPMRLRLWFELSDIPLEDELIDEVDLAYVVALRESMYRVTLARFEQSAPRTHDVLRINRAASVAPPPPALTANGQGIAAHSGLQLPVVISLLARDCIDVVGGDSGQHLRRCLADPCPMFFVDTSQGHRRRWCSKSCADRIAARAYRGR